MDRAIVTLALETEIDRLYASGWIGDAVEWYSLRRRVFSRQDREDIVHDAVLALLEAQPHGSVEAWLSAVIGRMACYARRVATRRSRTIQLNIDQIRTLAFHSAFPTPVRALEALQAAREVRMAISSMPPSYQVVVGARWLEECDLDETAARLGRTSSATSMVLTRACDRLNVLLGGDGTRPYITAVKETHSKDSRWRAKQRRAQQARDKEE